ncbi:anthranilate synthase [Cohnella kolymensis]|uniref:Anthranilate synthase n=1 Tax=Cohnella kolymensis TaxID=1590652 RepID=A0ABR5A210_9BACL|nr:anthranilate synthase component I family protein [Cohnella kolymensis]KIL34972.1 anthranilate synthase [Cohnella kolymensis]
MELVSLQQWAIWNGKYTLLPYVRTMKIETDSLLPLFWDAFWEDASPYACILESGKGGRYSVIGLKPVSVITGKGNHGKVLEPDDNGTGFTEARQLQGAPIEQVREWMRAWSGPKPEALPDCIGGAVGLWSYDMARSLEKLPESAQDDLLFPDFLFQRYEQLWIVDHSECSLYLTVHVPVPGGKIDSLQEDCLSQLYMDAQQTAMEMEKQWERWSSAGLASYQRQQRMRSVIEQDRLEKDMEQWPGLITSMSKSEFEQSVRRVQQYIVQGDVFQVNLSLRQSLAAQVSAETLYDWLRLINPSPYMGMLRTPDFSIVSASPELLVKLDNGKLSTRPIAGTRRRGQTPMEDRAMEDELLTNEKERAEHIMLVDLERNDIGRVAAYGSVHVPELMTVERYSHVMHLVSQVEGLLAPDKDAFDVLAAVFPGGTITGAPKIRTMEIIEELEPVRRGPYTGSIGWFDYSGNMEFNIIIRSILVRGGICHIQAGAGIVIDSDPEREFYECLNKAKALWKAVQHGETQGEPT